jgi:hypothetical protein
MPQKALPSCQGGQPTWTHVIIHKMRHFYTLHNNSQSTELLTNNILSSPLSLRQAATKSPQSEMNNRSLKRAPPNRSRGSSPPDKRSRTGPPSPPRSRTGSGAGLSRNATAAPADHRAVRAVGDQDAGQRSSAILGPLHVQSPVSRSGASTPVQNAPLAPSMLPKHASVNLSGKASLASLQGLKFRKEAVYNASKSQADDAASISTLANQLKAKASENDQLSERVKALEGQVEELRKLDMANIISRLTNLAPPPAKGEPESVSPAAARNKVQNLLKWKDAQSAGEDKEINAIKVFVQQEVDSKLGKVWDEIQTAEARATEKARSELDQVNKPLQAKVGVLENFKTNMEKQDLPSQLHNLSRDVGTVVSNERKTYEKLSEYISDTVKYLGPVEWEYGNYGTTLAERVKRLDEFVPQVQSLQNRQDNLEKDQKTLKARQNVFEADKKILQGRQTLFQTQKKSLDTRVERLDARITSLEKKGGPGPGPGFSKDGTPVASPSTNAIPAQDATVKTQLKKLSDDVQILQSSVTETDSLRTQIVTLDAKICSIEGKLNSVSDTSNGVETQTATVLSQNLADLDKDVQNLSDGLITVERTVHDHTGMIKVLEDEVPNIFARTMDPFKLEVGQKLEELTRDVTTLKQQPQHVSPPISSGEFTNLKNNVTRLLQQPQHALPAGISSGEVANLKQDVADLQTQVAEHSLLREQRNQELVNLIATANSGVESLRLSFRVLQDQYNNISSDELHGKMVQWFLQAYPSNAANMVQQFAGLRQDIQNVQNLFHQQNDPTIKAMKTAIDGIQKSLRSLNSGDSPFASTAAVFKLSTQVTALYEKMKSSSTAASTEDNKRLQDIRKIENTCTALASRVDKVEGAETILRKEVDTIKNDFMEPHRGDLASVGHMIENVIAVQKAVKMISERVATKPGQQLPLIEWPNILGDSSPDTAAAKNGKAKK